MIEYVIDFKDPTCHRQGQLLINDTARNEIQYNLF